MKPYLKHYYIIRVLLKSLLPLLGPRNFTRWVQNSISLFTLIMGRDDDSMVDEAMVAILDLFHGFLKS
jgi:hypothetical protein